MVIIVYNSSLHSQLVLSPSVFLLYDSEEYEVNPKVAANVINEWNGKYLNMIIIQNIRYMAKNNY